MTTREQFDAAFTKEAAVSQAAAAYPGVLARQGTSTTHPPHIPSLIGIQDLRDLDATGLVRNRSSAT